MTAEAIAKALGGCKAGNGWTARCPAHDDRNPSLSISTGKGGKVLLRCHAGCDQAQVIDALRARGLWEHRERHSIKRRTYKANPQKDTPHDRNDADRTEYALGIWQNSIPVPSWISDTLCRLATGGGFAVRQLYTDQDEVLFDAARPVILNGIEDIVTRPDLADRAVFLTLEAIPEERRRPEAELWAAFEAERPKILGMLLDAVVQGLKMLPETRLERLPRMADFALWASACETAIWPAGTFWSSYCGNRDEAVENVIEADPVAAAVRAVMAERTEWTGTASDLLGALSEATGERVAKSKTWPASPRALSGRLRRAATFLRKVGIEIDHIKEGRARTRIIVITAKEGSASPDHGGAQPSAPSASSALPPNGNETNTFGDTTLRTVDGVADGRVDAGYGVTGSTVRDNPLKSNGADGVDATDAKSPSQSGSEKNGDQGWRATL
jgi:hypothetical protein